MGKTLDLGRRIEIHPMDTHCRGISLGLYRRDPDGPQYLVHTYSHVEGAAERVAFLRQALIRVVGLLPAANDSEWLRFPCGHDHLRGLKRTFLDLCKRETGSPLAAGSLVAFDKKAGCDLEAASMGEGVYEMRAVESTETSDKRASALARGFAKLCEIEIVEGTPNSVRFACGTRHDEMIAALMYRAQNVRASMREQEEAAGRGQLAPPSQQK